MKPIKVMSIKVKPIEVKPIKVMSNLDEVHQGVVTQGEVTSA